MYLKKIPRDKRLYTTDIEYTGAITANSGVLLDSTKDYRNALAITCLIQLNSYNHVSGIVEVDANSGYLYFIPTQTAPGTLIRVKTLWTT